MKRSTLQNFATGILMVFFVAAWGASAMAAEGIESVIPAETQAFSVQIGNNDSKEGLALWPQTDNAMLLSPDKAMDLDPTKGVDLKVSLDKLLFKYSMQQKKSAEDLLLASPDLSMASSPDLPAVSTDFAASVGYQLDLLNKKLSIVPMMGLSYHGSDDNRLMGTEASSDWNSWWVGVDLKANPKPDLSIETSFLFHNARFSEKGADWGMGSESYKSEGEGKVFKLGLRQQLGNSWSAGILYSWQQWMAGKGELPSRLTDKSGNVPFGGDIQELNISLSYDF